MSKIYIMGDPHFSSSQPWRQHIGDEFLDWFEKEYSPEPDSYFIGLGDNTDDAANPGGVIRQLERFIQIAEEKHKHCYWLVGNHDLKRHKGVPHLSFEFFDLKSNSTILREPLEILTVAGLKILSMPHYNYRTDIASMYELYNELPEEILNQRYDLVIGHFADHTAPDIHSHTVDLSKVDADYIALGHIHTRINDHYLGSIAPFKVSEDDTRPHIKQRAVWVLSKEGEDVMKSEIPLPDFCKYRFVTYPESLPRVDEPVTVWTVDNCDLLSVAQNHYEKLSEKLNLNKPLYIRGVSSKLKQEDYNKVDTQSADLTEFQQKSYSDIYSDWKKESQIRLSRSVDKRIKDLLGDKKVS